MASRKKYEGRASANGNGYGLLIAHIGRLLGQHSVFRQTDVLGITAAHVFERRCNNLIALLEASYIFADGFNFPGALHPQYLSLGSSDT